MTTKVNLKTLAANAARAKQRLIRQEAKLKKLTEQPIERVGTGGQTIITSLGSVVVSAQTFDRNGDGIVHQFNLDKFLDLEPDKQVELVKAGVVTPKRVVIHGQAPRVSFRLNT